MKLCVLQPDYTGSAVDYQYHDPPRDLSTLWPEARIDHLSLHKTTTYRQLRESAASRYDAYVNLCEGYLDWDIPSLDVISSLEALALPYTGPGMRLYDPSKELMKYVAYTRGIDFPPFAIDDCGDALRRLRFPLFAKPAHAGDSLGVDASSLVETESALRAKVAALREKFGQALIEEYIPGREFTALVAGNPENRFDPLVLQPIEFVFPAGAAFKTYDLKVAQHHPECNLAVEDVALANRIRAAAHEVFVGFEGEGYARLDFRLHPDGALYFLDINFACSVFYPPGYEGSADYILKFDPLGAGGFLRHIVAEGIARHRRRERPYARRGSAIAGFGIYATREIGEGEIVYRGEERPHRLVSASHVARHWPAREAETFARYSLPTGGRFRILWDEDPSRWAPQNHSCDPNTGYRGLDVVALRPIPAGEELTLDYAECCDQTMPEFECRCGAPQCRGTIRPRSPHS